MRTFLNLYSFLLLVSLTLTVTLTVAKPVQDHQHVSNEENKNQQDSDDVRTRNALDFEEQMRIERETRGVVGEAVVARPGILQVLPLRGKIIAKIGEKIVVGLIKKVATAAWNHE